MVRGRSPLAAERDRAAGRHGTSSTWRCRDPWSRLTAHAHLRGQHAAGHRVDRRGRLLRERAADRRGRGRAAARPGRSGGPGRSAERVAVRQLHPHRHAHRRPAEVQGGARDPRWSDHRADRPRLPDAGRRRSRGRDRTGRGAPGDGDGALTAGEPARGIAAQRRRRWPAGDRLLAAPQRRAPGGDGAGHHRPRPPGDPRGADDGLPARRRAGRGPQGADRRRRGVCLRRHGARIVVSRRHRRRSSAVDPRRSARPRPVDRRRRLLGAGAAPGRGAGLGQSGRRAAAGGGAALAHRADADARHDSGRARRHRPGDGGAGRGAQLRHRPHRDQAAGDDYCPHA